jgi:hypothetical protein
MKYLLGIIILSLFFGSSSASSFAQDIVGSGAISSEIYFEGVGNHIRAVDGNLAIGNKLTVEDSALSLYSGFNLENGTDGTYRSWGIVGDTSHSININDASQIFMISQFASISEQKDELDNNNEYVDGGQTSIAGNFTGYAVEKIRSSDNRNKPLELSTVRMDGTFEINSEVKI